MTRPCKLIESSPEILLEERLPMAALQFFLKLQYRQTEHMVVLASHLCTCFILMDLEKAKSSFYYFYMWGGVGSVAQLSGIIFDQHLYITWQYILLFVVINNSVKHEL